MSGYFEQDARILDSHLLAIPLLDLAQQRQLNPNQLLKGTRLFHDDLLMPDSRISHRQLVRLVANAQNQLCQDDIGFLLGRRLFPGNLGNLGSALMNARHLADMLRISQCYQHQLFPMMSLSIHRSAGVCTLLYRPAISVEHQAYHRFLCEVIASAVMAAIKWRLGALPEVHIRFPYGTPDHIEQYQAYLGCACQFFAAVNFPALQITLANDLLYRPLADSNKRLKRHYLRQLPSSRQAVGLIQYIQGHMAAGPPGGLEEVATWLKVSPATLKRKLAAHNTSFQVLFDQLRLQQAIYKIIGQGLPIETVARELQFSDLTNFRRAFKRWTGMTPTALRQTLTSD